MPELHTFDRSSAACAQAAAEIETVLTGLEAPALALPTGSTPREMYAVLVDRAREGALSFSHATVFNLDEYLGLRENDERTFRAYMEHILWNRLAHRPAGWWIPHSDPRDIAQECEAYDRAIASAGGLDLAVLGIGENGHIAFNEPGTALETKTHVAQLAPDTRRAAAAQFGGLEKTPTQAVTMGLRTILSARRIVLLAIGANKAEILARALREPPSTAVPASFLQQHPNLVILADSQAASDL